MINNIRKLRKEQGLSIRKLSKLTGISAPTLSRYENEERNPKIENWQKLADFFEVSVEYLQGKTLISKGPDKEETMMMKNESKTITIKISKSRNCDIMYGWDVVQDEVEETVESLYALFALLRHYEIETGTDMENYLESLSKLVKAFRIITDAEEATL